MGSVRLYDDPLYGICFRAFPGLPGGGVGQDGCEAYGHVGKVLQQGLDDWVAASEAVPARRRIPLQDSLITHSAKAQLPLDTAKSSELILVDSSQNAKTVSGGKDLAKGHSQK